MEIDLKPFQESEKILNKKEYKRQYLKEYRKKRLLEDPNYRKREHKKYYAKNKEKVSIKKKAWRLAHPEYIKSYSKERQRQLRYQVLSSYSKSDQPYCRQCGFNDIRALCIDHINNDGYKDPRANSTLHLWIIKNNYPEGYQVLCANCNQIKEMENR